MKNQKTKTIKLNERQRAFLLHKNYNVFACSKMTKCAKLMIHFRQYGFGLHFADGSNLLSSVAGIFPMVEFAWVQIETLSMASPCGEFYINIFEISF